MEQQHPDLILILDKLDTLCAAVREQGDAIRTQSSRLDDTNTRLDVTNAKLDIANRELAAAIVQWKRLGTKTAELEGDVEELGRIARRTPIPPLVVAAAGDIEGR